MTQLTNLFEVRCKDGIVQLDLELDLYSCCFAPHEPSSTTELASPVWRDPPPLSAPIGPRDVFYFVLAYVSALARFPGRTVSTLGREEGPRSLRRGATVPVHVLARRFERLSLYLPVRPACLLASYALRRYLRLQGEDADWVIAVQLFPFRAHCWLAVDEALLAERAHLIEDYEPIVCFARCLA